MIRRTRKHTGGFTLMELLVVLAILGLLMSLVGPQVLNQLGGAKTKTAGIQIKDLEQALEMYKLDVGRFPSTSEGLEALVKKPGNATGWNGPYLKSDVPQDPWNNDTSTSTPVRRVNWIFSLTVPTVHPAVTAKTPTWATGNRRSPLAVRLFSAELP